MRKISILNFNYSIRVEPQSNVLYSFLKQKGVISQPPSQLVQLVKMIYEFDLWLDLLNNILTWLNASSCIPKSGLSYMTFQPMDLDGYNVYLIESEDREVLIAYEPLMPAYDPEYVRKIISPNILSKCKVRKRTERVHAKPDFLILSACDKLLTQTKVLRSGKSIPLVKKIRALYSCGKVTIWDACLIRFRGPYITGAEDIEEDQRIWSKVRQVATVTIIEVKNQVLGVDDISQVLWYCYAYRPHYLILTLPFMHSSSICNHITCLHEVAKSMLSNNIGFLVTSTDLYTQTNLPINIIL